MIKPTTVQATDGAAQDDSRYVIPAGSVNYDDRVKVLNHFDTFAVMDRWGDVHPYGKKVHGVYHQGMRFLSRAELRLNNRRPLLLSSSIKEDNDILSVDLTNPDLPECNVLEQSVHLSRNIFLRNGVYYEELVLSNFSPQACDFTISISFGADFKDLFEVRGVMRTVKANLPDLQTTDNQIQFHYKGLDGLQRATVVHFSPEDGVNLEGSIALIPATLAPQETKRLHYSILFNTEEKVLTASGQSGLNYQQARRGVAEDIVMSRELLPEIFTSNEQFNHWVNRSKADLLSLLTQTPYGKYPYAGVPWYNTAFGRDGIITAMEVVWMAPEIARDALNFLSAMQATQLIAAKDAEPGKILHETRTGEMANTGEIPFKEYYGTIDATPLFIMLAGMYYERTGDIEFIRNIWPNIQAALHWIDNYGDVDGDGFVEYKHKAENGLTNQGWKDSHDSIMYEDGTLCEPPIALAEVQGYVYAAKQHASVLALALDEKGLAQQLAHEAQTLKEAFNRVFWDEELSSYVLALDGAKKPCRVVASNAGHCLFTGIVDKEKAYAQTASLMDDNMFSGWGIRTLSKKEARYNPMSYHNGSIWPHDNALTAAGFARYGFPLETLKVMQALFDASLFIELQRLPELYCGFERRPGEGPTAYPVACSPQAWSVGAVFILIQSCLRIEVNALEKKILFNKPQLPPYIDKFSISSLRVPGGNCQFEVYRHQHTVGFNVIQKPEGWEFVVIK